MLRFLFFNNRQAWVALTPAVAIVLGDIKDWHLRTFGVVDRADSRLVTLNLAFLAFVALLPLPTSIVAEEGNLPSAAILYAVFVIVAGLLSTLLWVYPARSGLISVLVPPTLARHITYRALVVPAVFAASIPVALVSPYAAEAIWVLAVVGQSVVGRRFGLGQALEHALGAPEPGEVGRRDGTVDGPPAR